MSPLSPLYSGSLSLLTDLYQLTMAQGYLHHGMAEREALFHLFFRRCPFSGGYAIAAGLEQALGYLAALRFDAEDCAYLSSLTGNDGEPLFDSGFLSYLGRLRFGLAVDAIPEGTPVFAHEPLLRVQGSLLQCQLVETALLNIVNFSTLIATKASRICRAAQGEPVLEFGLRRAQGVDGGVSASRAAYVGGCAATSNVLAGRLYGIPVRGTHAHSWVMAFDNELESFRRYAEAMPNNCIFLVDTYDTLEGVQHAVQIGRELRERGHELVGVRLDSGDLAPLSVQARRLLDEGGFPDAAIVASNDLDEHRITRLKEQGARIRVWGVGTRLATAYDQAALGGVYKLAALREPGGGWDYRIKLSEQPIKIPIPGRLGVRRIRADGQPVGDVIYDVDRGLPEGAIGYDPARQRPPWPLPTAGQGEELLVPVLRDGRAVYMPPPLHEVRARTLASLEELPPRLLRIDDAPAHPVVLEQGLHERRQRLIAEAEAGLSG